MWISSRLYRWRLEHSERIHHRGTAAQRRRDNDVKRVRPHAGFGLFLAVRTSPLLFAFSSLRLCVSVVSLRLPRSPIRVQEAQVQLGMPEVEPDPLLVRE